MKFNHRFVINAPLNRVVSFHAQSDSLRRITPPPIIMQINRAPEFLLEADEIDFTLWFGPFPVRWIARIENISSLGFTDKQQSGPFRYWAHRHVFSMINDFHTEVLDEIELSLRSHPWWFIFGMVMWASLPILFTYRAWQTKKILEDKLDKPDPKIDID